MTQNNSTDSIFITSNFLVCGVIVKLVMLSEWSLWLFVGKDYVVQQKLVSGDVVVKWYHVMHLFGCRMLEVVGGKLVILTAEMA